MRRVKVIVIHILCDVSKSWHWNKVLLKEKSATCHSENLDIFFSFLVKYNTLKLTDVSVSAVTKNTACFIVLQHVQQHGLYSLKQNTLVFIADNQ